MTSRKTAAADDDRLCELTTTEVLHSQPTPTMLRDSQILDKRCIWTIKQVLRGDGGLVETQLGMLTSKTGIKAYPNLTHCVFWREEVVDRDPSMIDVY